MDISLALSGGGFRATVYHLGVLTRLAHEQHLDKVVLLSTVSGGSLCAGLIFALNDFKWPTNGEFLTKIAPAARTLLTTFDLQGSLIRRTFGTFWTLLETRADDLSVLMQKHWKLTARLSDLPDKPRWMINTTCYETGKNWRFERCRMGDYVFGYSNDTSIPLADAVAASAGFPGLIGALGFKTQGMNWFRYELRTDPFEKLSDPEDEARWVKIPIQPKYPQVHLWDGGVYDNHGLEGIHDFKTGWSKRFGFLVVSDAAGRSGDVPYQKGISALMRLSSGIMMNQVRSLRTRAIIERLENHKDDDQGVFLQMGNSVEKILTDSGHKNWFPEFSKGAMHADDVTSAALTPTEIRKLKPTKFENLYHHGYEVADATLCAYYPNLFKHTNYSDLYKGGL
jgi:NTE family protein